MNQSKFTTKSESLKATLEKLYDWNPKLKKQNHIRTPKPWFDPPPRTRTTTAAQLDSHLRVDFRGHEDAVVPGDGEFVVQDPARGAGPRLATAVGGEGMQVSDVAVCQQEVVA